jgi:hypothetical protein
VKGPFELVDIAVVKAVDVHLDNPNDVLAIRSSYPLGRRKKSQLIPPMLSPAKRFSATDEQAMSEACMRAWHGFEPNVANMPADGSAPCCLGDRSPTPLSAE